MAVGNTAHNQKEMKMDKSKLNNLLAKRDENIEKAKEFLLPKFLGKWVLHSLSATSSLDTASLSAYIASADLMEPEKAALVDFLASLNATTNNDK